MLLGRPELSAQEELPCPLSPSCTWARRAPLRLVRGGEADRKKVTSRETRPFFLTEASSLARPAPGLPLKVKSSSET